MSDLIHNLQLKLESSNLSSSLSNLNVSNNSHRSSSSINSINLGIAVQNSYQTPGNVERIYDEMKRRNNSNFWNNPGTKKLINITGVNLEGLSFFTL